MTATATAADQLQSVNPATGAVLRAVSVTAPDDVPAIVADVADVQPFWAALTLRDRARTSSGPPRCSSTSPTRSGI